ERRLAGGEVARRAVAEPAAAGGDVDSLGDGEFGRRSLHVFAEGFGRRDVLFWIDDMPAARFHRRAVFHVAVVNVKRDLELMCRSLRQIDHLAEFVALLAVGDAVMREGAERSSPRGDGGEAIMPLGRSNGPIIEDD